MSIADALTAIAAADTETAVSALDQALDINPDDDLAKVLRVALSSRSDRDVYGQPTSFEGFIDNGTNPNLYRAAIDALRSIHTSRRPDGVLDIGCGDGRVTEAVLTESTTHLSLLDPSPGLLGTASHRLTSSGHRTRSIELLPMTAIDLLDREPDRHWDIVQSTFALHTTRPTDRPGVLAYLRDHADMVAIVEFDVPAFDDRSAEHAAYAAERYQAGVAEYRDLPDVVTGFLLPVLVGQFDPTRPRLTYEQPAHSWASDFTDAGFEVTVEHLYDYWWAPAVLISATPT